MDKLYVADTNIIIDYIEQLGNYKIVLTSAVLREFEKIKLHGNEDLKKRVRDISRYVMNNMDRFHFDTKNYDGSTLGRDYSNSYQDDNILAMLTENQGKYSLLTEDVLLLIKAKGLGIDVKRFHDVDEETEESYSGYKEVYMTEDQLEEFYNGVSKNTYGLLINEYLIVKDKYTKEPLDAFKWDGTYYLTVNSKGFKTELFGHFKPLDIYQKCALDSLASNKLTMIKGKAGTGKSIIGINYAINQLEKRKIDKIIFFVNPTLAKNAQALGFYTGDKDDKLLQSSVGNMLSSKFGNKSQVEAMIQREEIVLLPFGDIRGFDTTGMNALVYIIEAQNLDKELMKLGIQRLSDDSKMIIDGDFTAQVDSRAYEGRNNGMRRVSEVFRNVSYYGEVELPNIYRSELAKRAELM